MMEDEIKAYHICSLPTEILLYIITFLSPKELTKCRQVCLRWKSVIDGLQKSERLWREYCIKDFSKVYKIARTKARAGLTWYHIYKSLSLWPKLAIARELRDEFASASGTIEQILDFQVLQNGIIAVHRKRSITYYDIETLEPSKRGPISGNYLKYSENPDTIIVLNFQLHLFIVRKILHGAAYEANTFFDNVKVFLLVDQQVFFVNLDEEIYVVNLESENLNDNLIKRCPETVMCLSYSKNRLNILTYDRNIFSVIENELIFICTLGPTDNLLHVLREYKFLEHLDWRVYVQWLYTLNQPIPLRPLSDIIVMRTYGDVVFVGCNWGVFRIYYAPYSEGEFDLYGAEPVKQYNFMERLDCPVLSDDCPIIQIDVLESEEGHTVLVAMPKKIAVLDFIHSFKRTASVAMLPYRDVQRVKILRIDDSM